MASLPRGVACRASLASVPPLYSIGETRFRFPPGAFGPLLERGIVSSLGWEMVKAATYPQTCAFGVGVLIGYVVGVHGMWIVGIERLALPRRFSTSAKSVDKPLFSYYKFPPIFFTFRSRRSEPS